MLSQMNHSWLEKVGDSGFSHWLVLPPKICLQLVALGADLDLGPVLSLW